jgi:hypothetical protein
MSRFCACLLAFLALSPATAHADDDARTGLASSLFPDGALSGSIMYFQRHRERYRIDEHRFGGNLHHSTLQAAVDYRSPFWQEHIGLDLGVFATTDLVNTASPDHEISFFPWDDPWRPDYRQKDARDGVSLYRAHIKARAHFADGDLWGKLGYFQPTGPGVLGVNWSLMPGTYQGLEAGGALNGDWGGLALAGAYVTRYKAPWYRKVNAFRDEEKKRINALWSVGARYDAPAGYSMEVAYGKAADYRQNAHFKLKYLRQKDTRDSLYLTYQFYATGEGGAVKRGHPNDHYAGSWGRQHYLALARTLKRYTLKTEFTYTRAPSDAPHHVGYFVYRLTGAYGGANGAYEPWWDNRSDWNHNRERAMFVGLSRNLDDWLPFSGVSLGASMVNGWGGRVYGVDESLKERSWSLDLGYTIPSGALKNTRASLHYTHYDNKTRLPSWTGYKNLFQDERDIKFLIVMPW